MNNKIIIKNNIIIKPFITIFILLFSIFSIFYILNLNNFKIYFNFILIISIIGFFISSINFIKNTFGKEYFEFTISKDQILIDFHSKIKIFNKKIIEINRKNSKDRQYSIIDDSFILIITVNEDYKFLFHEDIDNKEELYKTLRYYHW